VFNNVTTKNKVNPKYRIKNNITVSIFFFLKPTKSTPAKINVSRVLRLKAMPVFITFLSGSLLVPEKKIIRTIKEIIKNIARRISVIPAGNIDGNRLLANASSNLNNTPKEKSRRKYLRLLFIII